MIPEPLSTSTVQAIYRHYEETADSGFRPHLGASIIGQACERALWYTFRWVQESRFGGRMLRLFETGQLEEERLVKNLRDVGVEVHDVDDSTGEQYRISDFGGHFGGSLDGAGKGFREAPSTWHVLEFKTSNDRLFKELVKKGVEQAKPEHFTQMQVYMGKTGMTRAFYLSRNKNTDELYSERVRFDPVHFEKALAKAERIIFTDNAPERISEKSDYYKCRFCDFKDLCHQTSDFFAVDESGKDVSVPEHLPVLNCRTCLHATPEPNGTWSCAKFKETLSVDAQEAGCPKHLYLPDLLPYGEPVDADENGEWIAYKDIEGNTIKNTCGGNFEPGN